MMFESLEKTVEMFYGFAKIHMSKGQIKEAEANFNQAYGALMMYNRIGGDYEKGNGLWNVYWDKFMKLIYSI